MPSGRSPAARARSASRLNATRSASASRGDWPVRRASASTSAANTGTSPTRATTLPRSGARAGVQTVAGRPHGRSPAAGPATTNPPSLANQRTRLMIAAALPNRALLPAPRATVRRFRHGVSIRRHHRRAGRGGKVDGRPEARGKPGVHVPRRGRCSEPSRWRPSVRVSDGRMERAWPRSPRRYRIGFLSTAGGQRVLVDAEDVSADIRTPDISEGASQVSAVPEVRSALLGLQRRIGGRGQVVAEGRDTGTVVFPGAQAKFFLTAPAEERARRRTLELTAAGRPVDPPMFCGRWACATSGTARAPWPPSSAPLMRSRINSLGLTAEEVVARMEAIVKSRGG